MAGSIRGSAGVRVAWTMVALCAWSGVGGCGNDSSDGGNRQESDEREPAALYSSCTGPCEEGACVELTLPSGLLCTVTCASDHECPAPATGSVMCDQGQCRPYICDETRHLSLLGNGRICVRGVVTECASLTERPCNCVCGDDQRCVSGVCAAKLALDEACGEDEECSSSYCAFGQHGGVGRCRKKAGEACTKATARVECEAGCATSADGTQGYCLNECERYCGVTSCESRCKDAAFVCTTGESCRVRCTKDADCRDWELCEFEDITARTGMCVSRL